MMILATVIATALVFSFSQTRGNIPLESDVSLKLDHRILIKNHIKQVEARGISKSERLLVLYHMNIPCLECSIDVIHNNIRLLTSTIYSSNQQSSPVSAFYIFNVVGGSENSLVEMIPRNLTNVIYQDWSKKTSFLVGKIFTLIRLGKNLLSNFGGLMFLRDDMRGPLSSRENGYWAAAYLKLLKQNKVGIVGSSISCERFPHVQEDSAYVIKVEALFALMKKLDLSMTMTVDKIREYFTRKWNRSLRFTPFFNFSSILYDRFLGFPVFKDTCFPDTITKLKPDLNPSSWCDIPVEQLIFVPWGGVSMKYRGKMCEDRVTRMQDLLVGITEKEGLPLALPETIYGGNLYELYREYDLEMWKDRVIRTKKGSSVGKVKFREDKSNVCFLVRTSATHDPMARNSTSKFKVTNLDHLIKSLLRQSSPNWEAYFFITDDQPFDDKLRKLLLLYNDDRLIYFYIDPKKRSAYTTRDAGYKTTDLVLRSLVDVKSCKWLSATNGDNVYGSEVVERVIKTPERDEMNKLINMIFAPFDSRNTAHIDYLNRVNLKEEKMQKWNDYCVGLIAQLNLNGFTYAIQPLPKIGKMDLAALFLRRTSFANEKINFANFTNFKLRCYCTSCHDGCLTEYLVRTRGWSYYRLPIDGLKSLVFHGPSPTLCIASGGVWYDHTHVNNVGCLAHKTVQWLERGEQMKDPMFDWEYYHKFYRICLRLHRSKVSDDYRVRKHRKDPL